MKKNLNFYLQLSFTILICAFLVIPVIMSIMAGVTENYFVGLSSGLTVRWIKEVFSLYMDTIYLSMYIALSTLVMTLLLGVPSAYVLAKKQNRLTRMVEELLILPIAIPGLAIALALIITYGDIKDFRTSWLFILVGHVLYTLPFMLRSVLSVLHSIDFKKLEEGAYSLGAGFWRSFFTIILPNCKSGILAGSLMVLTLSMGEFNLTWMLHTPLTKTLPVGLADSYASMRLEIGSAYTLIFLLMILPLLIALQTLGGFGEKKTDMTKQKNYKLNNGIKNG